MISHQQGIDKICLYTKDPCKAKFHLLTNQRERPGLKYFNNFKPFIKYFNDLNFIYENLDEHNSNTTRKIFIMFGDVMADICSNKKPQKIII